MSIFKLTNGSHDHSWGYPTSYGGVWPPSVGHFSEQLRREVSDSRSSMSSCLQRPLPFGGGGWEEWGGVGVMESTSDLSRAY